MLGALRALDRFRAPVSGAERARRRNAGLSPPQEALLAQEGYPKVMEEFRFHMTLTAQLPQADIALWSAAVRRHLPDQFVLCGALEDGRFEVIHGYRFTG